MNVDQLLAYLSEWGSRFDSRLSELIESLEKRVQGLQRALWREILEAFGELFGTDGKRLARGTKNVSASLAKLERLLDRFEGVQIAGELRLFAAELIEVGGLTVEYYEATDGRAKARAIEKSLNLLRAVIGIDGAGALIAGGYLDRLGKTEAARELLRSYVVNSIVSGRSLFDFRNGFRELIVGNPDTDGALQRYWRQYAYDTYNKAHEVVNVSMADELNMSHFIYQGSIIPTSRQFCRKRAGKVFTRAQADTWKNDPDLIDPKTKDTYNPLIERGRYNCRHWINWISEDLAAELKKKQK